MKKVFLFIALVSVFAACQPEELKTIFKSENAQLTINVTSVINSVNGDDVTNDPNTTRQPFTTTGNPDIPADVAVVSATYQGVKGETKVGYPHIFADTEPVVMGAIVYIPGTVGNYEIDVKSEFGDEVELGKFLLAEGYNHGYSHAGYDYWVENASDYTLFDTCTYDDYFVPSVTSTEPEIFEDAFAELIQANFESTYIAAVASQEIEEDLEYEFEVPAWSLYQVENILYKTPIKFYVLAKSDGKAPKIGKDMDGFEGVIGTFEGEFIYNEIGKRIEEHPSHAGHGHSAGHGNGSNAGGGLVPADE